jgi:TetR/AcrR family transcriptional repressor of nem operon
MKQLVCDKGLSQVIPAAARRQCESKVRLLETASDLIARASYGSVSVDDLCNASQLKKGSFYYFFKSKAELAAASLQYNWDNMRPAYDGIFAKKIPPLRRLEKYLDYVIDGQVRRRKKYGFVIGCVFTAIGCELSAQEEVVRQKVEEIISCKCQYLAAAIGDAQADGSVTNPTPAAQLAEELHSLILGTVLTARIHNDLAPVYAIKASALRLLAADRFEPATAAI